MSFLTLLAIVLPALAVALSSYFLLKKFLESQEKQKLYSLKSQNQKEALPLRLQACERVMLMLERMKPGSLLFRVDSSGLSAGEYQGKLLASIREEFEHNLSQQIYLSASVWPLITAAREEMVRLINSAALELEQDASGKDLAQLVFQKSVEEGVSAIEKAGRALKAEVQELF